MENGTQESGSGTPRRSDRLTGKFRESLDTSIGTLRQEAETDFESHVVSTLEIYGTLIADLLDGMGRIADGIGLKADLYREPKNDG